MSAFLMIHRFSYRLRRKVLALLPVVISAVALFAGLSAVTYVVAPYLPAAYQPMLAQLQAGDWQGSRTSLRHMLDGYGAAQSAVFLAIQMVQVLVAPIPG